ncbi:acyltransferase family protein [Maridesulfovibrio sp.]|uniref:acyltransferase family protein n=1 Tax=Maridesulfovibrio sp. TaxID=2795000 RepID=UPI0039EEA33E
MSISYRAEIDGLRAIAVTLVILNHIKIGFFSGGFIGVDIFFVISGYLITSIILKELESNNFSYTNFYSRRIKRIMPALLFMLVACFIVGLFILFPAKIIALVEGQFATLSFWSNIFMWKYVGGYWFSDASRFPLTHTWSLSVEEQFYFIWPIILVSFYSKISKKYWKPCLLITLSILLLCSEILSTSLGFGFYLIPSRAFELFMGSGLAISLKYFPPKFLNNYKLYPLIHLAGITLILIPSVLYTDANTFPGINAFWPCLGTVLLLIPHYRKSLITNFLSSKPAVSIGKISYSLYLWHWPPIAFCSYMGYSISKYRPEIIIYTVAISIISYYFIEQPLRKSQKSFQWSLSIFVIIPLIISAGSYYTLAKTDILKNFYRLDIYTKVTAIDQRVDDTINKLSPSKISKINKNVIYTILNKEVQSPPSAILIGDSHATMFIPLVEALTKPFNIKTIALTRASTQFLPNVYFYHFKNNRRTEQLNKRLMNNEWAKLIKDNNIKFIFLAGQYSGNLSALKQKSYLSNLSYNNKNFTSNIKADSQEAFSKGLYDAVNMIVEENKIPIIIKDIPQITNIELQGNYLRNKIFGSNLPIAMPALNIYKRHHFEDQVIDDLAQAFPSLIVIDPKKILCPNYPKGSYIPVIDNMPIYYDSNHFNAVGAKLFAKEYVNQCGNPLINFY